MHWIDSLMPHEVMTTQSVSTIIAGCAMADLAIPELQTAVQIKAFGVENISVEQVPVTTPGPGQALVRITVRPVNPSDVFSVIGFYPGYKPKSFPATLGLEGVGKIVKLGEGASGRLTEGQRVVAVGWRFAAEGGGTWQQYVLAAEEDLVAVPDDLTDEAASQALINPVTVVGMFEELAPPKDDLVIVTAAGSALGRMTLRYAAHKGIRTLATCRRPEQVEELKQAGATDVVVLTPTPDTTAALVAKARELTGGRGAWGALDSIAGPVPAQLGEAVRNGGTVIVYGAMGDPKIEWNVGLGLFRLVALKGFWLVPWLASKPIEQQRAVLEEVLKLMVTGVLPAHKVDGRPLTEAAAAIRDSGNVGREAKIVLVG